MLPRRVVLKGAAIGALVFTVDGVDMVLTPREAKARDLPLQTLSEDEAASIESLGDVLLPGAKDAGIANYIDHQLSGAPDDCLLIARSVSIPPPYVNFYRAGLIGLDGASQVAYQKRFVALEPPQKIEFVKTFSAKPADGWEGPPSPFFYFVLRNDATDVVYGTVEGFEKLGVPYMPHITPERKW
ncbi:MAG TPA: gluconate 2-dehydrogenase subunit 3 family protein [Stellaceae bacterium]|nr:gluconate 2-dehydrogenase subunit 3 family protein [Stellaceae bacterium]